MKYAHIMVDLETLATVPEAVVLSVGVAAFDPLAHIVGVPNVGPTFHRVLSVDQQAARGRRVDPVTQAWWAEQGEAARGIFAAQQSPVEVALGELAAFLDEHCAPINDGRLAWGNGADFDLVLLKHLHDGFGLPTPWRYHSQRCFRTLKNAMRADYDEIVRGTPPNSRRHDAEQDALWQAGVAVRLLRRLVLRERIADEARALREYSKPVDHLLDLHASA